MRLIGSLFVYRASQSSPRAPPDPPRVHDLRCRTCCNVIICAFVGGKNGRIASWSVGFAGEPLHQSVASTHCTRNALTLPFPPFLVHIVLGMRQDSESHPVRVQNALELPAPPFLVHIVLGMRQDSESHPFLVQCVLAIGAGSRQCVHNS